MREYWIMPESCFVICPFHDPFNEYYSEIFQPAIRDAGLLPMRADEIFSPGMFMRDVVTGILRSSVVLAELSGRNANVFYELGAAHAYSKPVIMITQEENAVPSDLQGLRWISYQTRSVHWGTDLQRSIKETIKTCLAATAVERARLFIPPSMEAVDPHSGVADRIVRLSPTQRRMFDLLKLSPKPVHQKDLEASFPDRSGGEVFYRLETLRLQGLISSSVVSGSGSKFPVYEYSLSDEASAYYKRTGKDAKAGD
jgi:hypothetical protein